MEKIKKNDFIEIEFTGRSNDKIFDTTDKKEAEEMGLENAKEIKPLVISVGNQMILKGIDEGLERKEVGKSCSIHLTPEKAFGPRNPQLIKTYSLNHFRKQNMNPYPGMAIQLDNSVAKVLSVSGGRVTMDFNNPLAGKEVNYNIKILRKITDDKEKINALQDFFFKQRFEFTIKDKKVILKDQTIEPFLQMLKDKFKDMTGFEFEVEKKEENKEKEKSKDSEKTKKKKEDKKEIKK